MIKIIVGIGNPDLNSISEKNKYNNTRHNVGFLFLDYLAKKIKAKDFEFNKNLNSSIIKIKLEKNQILLVKPQTYVNNSGEAIKKIIKNLNLKSKSFENLIVVHDDLDIPFGNIKLSFDKNSGGHKGIESIIKALKTKKFYRLRIGLGSKSLQKARQLSDKKRNEFVIKYVLSEFNKNEKEKLKDVFKKSYERLSLIINH
jgi:PTH1 family peptidyl-tRNA hydrolase